MTQQYPNTASDSVIISFTEPNTAPLLSPFFSHINLGIHFPHIRISGLISRNDKLWHGALVIPHSLASTTLNVTSPYKPRGRGNNEHWYDTLLLSPSITGISPNNIAFRNQQKPYTCRMSTTCRLGSSFLENGMGWCFFPSPLTGAVENVGNSSPAPSSCFLV